MKILTTQQYKDLLNKIEHLEKTRDDYYERIVKAENLKSILDKITSTSINGVTLASCGGSWTIGSLPDNVLVYVDDMLGGKVIKQEGNKCIVIDKTGSIKTGLTKSNVDKGYTYKLVRE